MSFDMALFLAVLPFCVGITIKTVVFILSSGAQKTALETLEQGHKKESSSTVLTAGQRNVLLSALSLSTASITAASTLITSLVAFLVVALKYQQRWIWGCWIVDLLFSIVLWRYIRSRKEPYQRVWKLKVGTFLLLLSGVLDAAGLVPTVIATRNQAQQNCSVSCPQ